MKATLMKDILYKTGLLWSYKCCSVIAACHLQTQVL